MTSLTAAPNQAYGVFLGLPQPVLPSPFGGWWLGTGSVLTLASGTTDALGSRVQVSTLVPAGLQVGEQYVLQAVTFDAAQGLSISAPRVQLTEPAAE